MTRRRRSRRGLAWALGLSAALHVLAAVLLLDRPHPQDVAPAEAPEQEAMVDVVMGGSAESDGAPAAEPAPSPVPVPPEPESAPPPTPPAEPAPSAEAPVPPPVPAAPPRPAEAPAKPAWQASSLLGNGTVGAAELVGARLRPAVGGRGNIPPGYPPLSAELGEQGVAVLRMEIGADGLVTSVQVVQSSGYRRLDEAARTAVARWRFTPAMRNGEPVGSAQDLPVHFRLN